MTTDQEFFQWWHTEGNDRTVLLSLSKYWIKPPTDVLNCVKDMVNYIETDGVAETVRLSVDTVTNDVVDIFVETAFDFVLNLMKHEEEKHVMKEIRSTLREIVRRVEAASPIFLHW